MVFCIFILVAFKITCTVSTCEKADLVEYNLNSSRFFIYAALGIVNGSLNDNFDLKTFLSLLEFENPSRKLPIVVNKESSFMSPSHLVYCHGDEPNFGLNTEMILTPPNVTINGILYACEVFGRTLKRFIFYDNASWSKQDMRKYCTTFQGVPTRLLGKMNQCAKNSKIYKEKCMQIPIKDKAAFDMKFGGFLIFIAVLFAVFSVYNHFKVNSVSNVH